MLLFEASDNVYIKIDFFLMILFIWRCEAMVCVFNIELSLFESY